MAGAIRNIFVEFQLKAGKLVAELKSVDKVVDKSKLKIDNITESLKKHRGALLGASAATGLLSRNMLNAAVSEEKFRLNIKSLTAATVEGQAELQTYNDLITDRPAFTSKEETAALISQLKLYQLTEEQIVSLTPVIQHMVGVGKTNEEILLSVGSALGGQYRSLKMMGITLMEADITGWIKENKKELAGLTIEQKKAAAFTALFVPAATKVIGNFEDVEKSAFIQTLKMNAAMSDLSGDIGATFLPGFIALTKGIGAFVRALNDIPFAPAIIGFTTISILMLALAGLAIPPVIAGLTMLTGGTFLATAAQTGYIAALKGTKIAMLATAAATHIWTAAQWLLNIALTANPIGLVILAVVGLALVIQDLITGIKGGESVIFGLGDKLLWLLGPIGYIIYAFKNLDKIVDFLVPAFTKIIDKLKGFGALFKEAGLFLIDTFIKGMTFGLLDTKKLTAVFNGIREYLPFSDAKKGPLSDLTLSGQKFMQTFAKGAEMQNGLMGNVMTMPAKMIGSAAGAIGGTNITVNISDVKLSGDDASLQKFGEVAVAAVEKALGKINQKQATAAGY